MKRRLAILCAAALIFLFAAISAQAAPAVNVELIPPGPSFVDVGATLRMDAVLTPADTGAVVTWTSSHRQYATVSKLDDDTCVITGKAMGRTYIYAKVDGKIAARRLVTVTKPKASAIKLNSKSVTLNPSGSYSTYVLRATTSPSPSYHSDSIEWTTDDLDGSIISIEPSEDRLTCTVTAKADGSETRTCTVTATLAKNPTKSATCLITVKKIPEKYVRVTTGVVVPLYASRKLTAVVYPASAFDKTVTWEPIKNDGVVELTDNGDGTALVKGLRRNGTAIFRVKTANGRSALCAMTVKLIRYSRFAIYPSRKVLQKDDTFSLTPKWSPTYVSYPDVIYSTSDESIAAVDPITGVVTGVGRGYATITAIADNGRVKDTTSVHVISNDETLVTISAVGDIMLGGDPRNKTFKAFEKIWSSNTPDYFLKNVKGAFSGITVANFEIPLTNSTRINEPWRNYRFRGKPGYVEAIDGIIDVVDLDNNHIKDFGQAGYNDTRSILRSRGIGYFGLGRVEYRIQNGVKIGFVGYRPEMISLSKIKAHLRSARKNCDILIASFHWGGGYRPNATQKKFGRAAIDAGADLVLGHHSHVVSGIELYKGKHIVYGLGTIVSAVRLPSDTDTFIYKHTFSVSGERNVTNSSFEIVPVKMTANTQYNDAQPVLVEKDSAEYNRIKDKIKYYSPASNPFP